MKSKIAQRKKEINGLTHILLIVVLILVGNKLFGQDQGLQLPNDKFLYFDSNGNVSAIKTYTNDTLNGPVFYFYSNGLLQKQGFFRKGLKEGTFKYWGSDGTLLIEMIYECDLPSDTVYYFSKSKPVPISIQHADTLHNYLLPNKE